MRQKPRTGLQRTREWQAELLSLHLGAALACQVIRLPRPAPPMLPDHEDVARVWAEQAAGLILSNVPVSLARL